MRRHEGTCGSLRPANKKAGSRLVVLVDGPVQECLKAAARPWAPARGITTVSDLQKTHVIHKDCPVKSKIFLPSLNSLRIPSHALFQARYSG